MSSQFLFPLGLVVVASFVFFQFTLPTFSNIGEQNTQIDSLNIALNQSEQLHAQRNELNNSLNQIPEIVRDKVEQGIPPYSERNFATTLIELQDLLVKSRVFVTGLGFRESSSSTLVIPDTRSFTITFETNTPYNPNLDLLLENLALWFKGSLIEELKIVPGESGGAGGGGVGIVKVSLVLSILFFNS